MPDPTDLLSDDYLRWEAEGTAKAAAARAALFRPAAGHRWRDIQVSASPNLFLEAFDRAQI